MPPVLRGLLLTLLDAARSRASLHLELLALRLQVQVLQRTRPRRVALTLADRWLWVWLSRAWTEWPRALVIVQPATVEASLTCNVLNQMTELGRPESSAISR